MTTETIIPRQDFGTEDGKPVFLFTLTNRNGMEARITNYGGIVTHLTAPDRNGTLADIVLGYDQLQDYIDNSPYFGALIGRYGNRIGGARFTLDGVTYELEANNGPNSLHGGSKGFHAVVWEAEPLVTGAGQALRLTHVSADGEEGFPGTLTATVTYTLTDDNELRIDYEAETDAPTPVALTHHGYFNLTGDLGRPVTDHILQMNARFYTPVDDTLIPTGEIAPVAGTPFDFGEARPIGLEINAENEQLAYGGGYDHNFVLDAQGGGQNNGQGDELALAATVAEPLTGRVMEVWTTEPGMQFYSGNFLSPDYKGKGAVFDRRTGFCLETQHFPDSPNQPDFPDVILRPGEKLTSTTVYRFSAR